MNNEIKVGDYVEVLQDINLVVSHQDIKTAVGIVGEVTKIMKEGIYVKLPSLYTFKYFDYWIYGPNQLKLVTDRIINTELHEVLMNNGYELRLDSNHPNHYYKWENMYYNPEKYIYIFNDNADLLWKSSSANYYHQYTPYQDKTSEELIEMFKQDKLPDISDPYDPKTHTVRNGWSINEVKPDTPSDPTNPTYYKKGKFETFDFVMECVKDLPPQEACCVKDVLKYVIRYKEKNGAVDLKKARWYLDKLITFTEERECSNKI